MSYSFERPVGAAMDVKELEYIAALVQTQHNVEDTFRDASIEATDVKNYLMSRYGIKVTKEQVRKLIFHDLAGGNSVDESLDIPEIVTILLIPYLRKVSTLQRETIEDEDYRRSTFVSKFEKEAYEKKLKLRSTHDFDSKILGKVLSIILNQATGSDEPQPLTKDLLRKIFKMYDETELCHDENLLNDMIAVAAGDQDGAILDVEAFSRALTSDLDCYNQDLETKFTTHYEDVFGLVTVGREISEQSENEETEGREDSRLYLHAARDESVSHGENFTRVFTFPQIDYLADSFRDKTQYVMVWLAVIFGYLTYFNPLGSYGIQVCKEENRENFGCQVGLSIILWFAILGVMLITMAPAVMILSLGNNIHRHNPLEIAAGILGIAGLIFFPALYDKIDNRVFKTTEIDEEALWVSLLFRSINLTIGSILLCIQLSNIVRCIVPDNKLKESKLLTLILRGSGVRSEFGIKQATIKKVHNMVKHAYDLHIETDPLRVISENSNDRSSDSVSLLNYMKLTEKRETCGGFIWAWRSFLTDSLVDEEGIWMHTRLLAGNLAQLICTLGFAFFGVFIAIDIVHEMYPSEVVPQNNRCGSYVDPSQCYFPIYEDATFASSSGMGFCNNVRLTNSSCLEDFIAIPEDIQATFCELLSENSLLPQFNQYIDADDVLQQLNQNIDTCPDLYIPYPSPILTAFEGSDTDNYCVAPITVCSPTGLNSNGENQGNCIIGNENAFPFQFRGEACVNYTEFDDGYDLLYTQKIGYEQAIEDTMPTKRTIQASLGIGVFVTFVAGIANTVVNIPSQIITTMKFRTGVIETLRDKQFLRQRVGMLNLTFLLGASVWGALIMSSAVFVLITVTAFLLMYHITRPYALGFVAALIGVLTTLVVKAIVSTFLNQYNFVGFYRKRPVLANIANVGFECWHLAVTSGFIIVRAIKLIFIVIFNLGRFDRPILAKGVGEIGPVVLDNFPNIFAKDLLATDAHRHPYIERMGMMYLMKLKHGDKFARRTGSIWRLLFVFALMPYLRKNRIAAIAAVKDPDELTPTIE